MKKEELAKRLARESGISTAAAADQLDSILSGILRRIRQGHHAVQRISVGGLSAAENVAQERGRGFRKGDGEVHGIRQKQGCHLSARLVRSGVGRLEHDPEKWIPVFRKNHASSKCLSNN